MKNILIKIDPSNKLAMKKNMQCEYKIDADALRLLKSEMNLSKHWLEQK